MKSVINFAKKNPNLTSCILFPVLGTIFYGGCYIYHKTTDQEPFPQLSHEQRILLMNYAVPLSSIAMGYSIGMLPENSF